VKGAEINPREAVNQGSKSKNDQDEMPLLGERRAETGPVVYSDVDLQVTHNLGERGNSHQFGFHWLAFPSNRYGANTPSAIRQLGPQTYLLSTIPMERINLPTF
jgi:hypothetical protein